MNRAGELICKNTSSDVCIVARVEKAESMSARMKGLLGRSDLEADHGLLLMDCGSIHTFGMQFAIDVISSSVLSQLFALSIVRME